MTSATDHRGQTRRDLLKKGAVGGAVVWAAPLVTSSPAFAATGKCSGSKPCKKYYYVKITGPAGQEDPGSGDGGSGCSTYTLAQLTAGCPAVTPAPTFDAVNGGALVSGSHTTDGGSFTFNPGVVPIYIQLKLGNAGVGNSRSCFTFQYVGSGPLVSLGNAQGEQPTHPDINCQLSATASGSIASGVTITYTRGACGIGGISHTGAYFCD